MKRDNFFSLLIVIYGTMLIMTRLFLLFFFYNEVVNKHINMWTIDGKIKMQQGF